jgi:hypothetical protein
LQNLQIQTEVEIGRTISFFVTLTLALGALVMRPISDARGTVETFIRHGRWKDWDRTESQPYSVLDGLPGGGGPIWFLGCNSMVLL